MSRVSTFALAGVTALVVGSGALAADLAASYQPVATGGWYLRGYIGQSNQFVNSISHPSFATAPQFTFFDKGGFDSAPFFGAGVGYQWNSWFRTDVTGEYRGKASFHALDRYFNSGYFTNDYTASKSEWVALVNAYIDLGTWWCITPFIGAGVGGARVAINGFTDQSIASNPVQPGPALAGIAFGDNVSKWNFAWAAHAGLAYKVTPNFTVELAYRYLDMGDGLTGDLRAFDGTNNFNNPMTFKHITSHDLKLGVRWDLTSPQVYAPPLVTKG